MEIGAKIRELRIRNILTPEELAQKLNVTPQTVSRWENNKSLDILCLFFDNIRPVVGKRLKVIS